jgi:membrane-associated protein
MAELLYSFAAYAPLGVFTAAVLDIFFLTGYFFYGVTSIATILILYGGNFISVPEIVIYSLLGTLTGNTINFYAGQRFSTTKKVATILRSKAAETAREFLKTRGLFLFILFGRFITVARPIYALIIGTLSISYKRFLLYETLIAFFWVTLWLWLMITGLDVALWIKDQLL